MILGVHGRGLGPRPWVSKLDFFASRVGQQDPFACARQPWAARLPEYEGHHACLGELLWCSPVRRLRTLAAWFGRRRQLPIELRQAVDLTYQAQQKLGSRQWVSKLDFFGSRVHEKDPLVLARQQPAARLLEGERFAACLGAVLRQVPVHRLWALAAWLGCLRELSIELREAVDLAYEA